MSEHDAWLVDLDGTLYASSPVRVAMLAELSLSGWNVLGPLRRFRSEHELLRTTQAERVPSPYHLQLERTAGALGLAPALVEASVREWMIERPGKWLRRFRRSALIAELSAIAHVAAAWVWSAIIPPAASYRRWAAWSSSTPSSQTGRKVVRAGSSHTPMAC